MKMTKLLRIRGQHHFVELHSEALILTQCKPMHQYGEREKKNPPTIQMPMACFSTSQCLCAQLFTFKSCFPSNSIRHEY